MSTEKLPNRATIVMTHPLPANAVRYRTLIIKPKLDFGTGYLIKGVMVKEGWLVSDGCCNIMPGATWFETIDEAKHAIDILIAVKGDSQAFWEIMQPFTLTPGDKHEAENCTVTNGRHYAVVRDHVVVEVGIRNPERAIAPTPRLEEAHV
jgi:hypothetical protein